MKLGCTLLNTLMASPDGVRFLATEDEFLPQIVKGFRQLDPVSLSSSSESVEGVLVLTFSSFILRILLPTLTLFSPRNELRRR